MAAQSYYSGKPVTAHEQQQEHLLSSLSIAFPQLPSGQSSGQSSPLKPLQLLTNMENYNNQHVDDFEELKSAQRDDEHLKGRIRRLRLISRILAFAISIGVFVPISMTVQKFLSTQNVYHDVTLPNGDMHSRTAWANDSKVWPTWMYFVVAAIALLLNLAILLSYIFGGIKAANNVASVASAFSWMVMLGQLVVWGVAASLYRTEKDKDGKSNDLWGWTCSPAAKAIQEEFANEVNFNRYCNVQSISWYIGLVQVAAAALTVFIFALTLWRSRTKRNVREQGRRSTLMQSA